MKLPRRVPEDIRAILGKERLLARGTLFSPHGGFVLASDAALYWSGPPAGNHQVGIGSGPALGDPEVNRIPWQDVITAAWSDGFLDLLRRDDSPGGAREVRLRLADEGRLPEVVRERVMFTVLVTRQVALRPVGQPVRKVVITARRAVAGSEVRWEVIYDPSGGPLTASQSRAVDTEIDKWADQLGIGPSTGPVARIARVDPP